MPPPALEFSHMGLYVTDLEAMRDFYTRVLCFLVTDEGLLRGRTLLFLSRDAREHHQIVLVEGRPPEGPYNVVNQVSLRAGSLVELRAFIAGLRREGITDLRTVTHGMAWSVYFPDPEGNHIEVFVDSPWYVEQPISDPMDLERAEEEILEETEARYKDLPSFQPFDEWRAALAKRIAEKG
jgi:catechol-2,3-dioxygenase